MRTCVQALLLAVLLSTTLYAGAGSGVYVRELVAPGDFGFGIFDRVEMSEAAGGLVLAKSMNCIPYLWVPSSSGSLVSKIDARSGREMARYQMGPVSSGWTPSAVATDYAGNAYVACGGAGSGHIVRIEASGASKSVARAPGATSFDFTGDGRADVLPWGKDARVSVVGEVGSEPGCLAFDEHGLLWVGLSSEQCIVAMDAATGAVYRKIYLDGSPDTMIAGSRDSLWVLCENSRLVCVDPLLGAVRNCFDLGELHARSICEGDEKTLWLGTTTGLAMFDVASGCVAANSRADTKLAGVAVDRAGNVWAACPELNSLTRFSPIDLRITAQTPTGLAPNSLAADGDGYIWALNRDSSSASRIDARSVACVATALTGPEPASSTPFAACVIKPGISPSGSWRGLFDGKIPGAAWGTITWNANLSSSRLKVEARSAEVPTDIINQQFQEVSNGLECALPNGRFLEVRVSFAGGSNTTPVLTYLRVDGRNLPPITSNATPTVSIIRRHDHQFEAVGIRGVTDPEGHEVTVNVTGVTQDEPVAGLWNVRESHCACNAGRIARVDLFT